MSDHCEEHLLGLSRSELVSLYVILTRHESELDRRQQEVLERVAGLMYELLSVEEMEEIESYYNSL